MTAFLSIEDVLEIHRRVLETTGGSTGVRDLGLLDSAIARPQATFGGQQLYPDLKSQAGALLQSLICNHPFIDGNKRTAFTAMVAFLRLNEHDLAAQQEDTYQFVIHVASSRLDQTAIMEWLASRILPTN